MTVEELEAVLSHDYSAGTDEFRDELLARCIEVLDAAAPTASEVRPAERGQVLELTDADLGLLAAAGSPAPPTDVAQS